MKASEIAKELKMQNDPNRDIALRIDQWTYKFLKDAINDSMIRYSKSGSFLRISALKDVMNQLNVQSVIFDD